MSRHPWQLTAALVVAATVAFGLVPASGAVTPLPAD
ncbi:hypothetical protein SAMN05216174_1076 [Actinokineospora iranica]|uniref:Uncharacterized protein n=1 Tax=Actinokineospora iranica TaxID=1271860 RepID=A0A1G6RSQ3_9PSEU|nr:hypothetical protein SAMN05216174_1076 [Actinokineospora iranica]